MESPARLNRRLTSAETSALIRSSLRAATMHRLRFRYRTLAVDALTKEILATAKGVWAPVQTPAELHDDPQTRANGFIRDVHYPTGTLRLPVPPILFDEEAGDPPLAPDFAQHTDEVLREVGIADDEIARLRETGAIA